MGQYTEKGYEFDQSAPKIQEIFTSMVTFMRIGGPTAVAKMMEDINTLDAKVLECETSAMGIIDSINFNVHKSEWVFNSEDDKYPFSCTIASDKANINTIPFVFFSDDSLEDAGRFGISANASTGEGIVTIKSKLRADTDLTGVCYIIGQASTTIVETTPTLPEQEEV